MQSLSTKAMTAKPTDDQPSASRRPARRKRQVGSGDASSPDFVEVLARGLSIMRCFGPDTGSLGNLELAQLTGLSKSIFQSKYEPEGLSS